MAPVRKTRFLTRLTAVCVCWAVKKGAAPNVQINHLARLACLYFSAVELIGSEGRLW